MKKEIIRSLLYLIACALLLSYVVFDLPVALAGFIFLGIASIYSLYLKKKSR